MILPIEITRERGIENNIPVDVDGFYERPFYYYFITKPIPSNPDNK
jgi:hypothetical protein